MSAIYLLRKFSTKPPSRFHRNLLFSTFSRESPLDISRTTRPISSQRFVSSSIWCFPQSKILPNRAFEKTSGVSVRQFSTSVETNPSDKSFERIHVQNGVIVERIHKIEDETVSKVNVETIIGGGKVVREESEAEKEAWRILENAVVRYCGSPVGTVAANDPGDKMPLNYDQVFIRDFVPSALAFLLKGEGDIVRNFLLHTLQLQVCMMNLLLMF